MAPEGSVKGGAAAKRAATTEAVTADAASPATEGVRSERASLSVPSATAA